MSEQLTPTDHYNQYIQLMDSYCINEELAKINAIHHSLDEHNPMTYVILRETNRAKFTPSQIQWLDHQIDKLHERNRQSFEKSLQNVDIELASAGILDKSTDHGTKLV
jgi:hypothetical protein